MSTVPAFVDRLIDDAAIFPPGNLPLPEAVAQHVGIRRSGGALSDVVGPFVVDIPRLAATLELVHLEPGDPPFDLSVIVREPGTIADVLDLIGRDDDIDLVGLEVVTTASGEDLDRVLTDALRASATPSRPPTIWVELTDPSNRVEVQEDFARIARHGLALKLRTGGTVADAFPSPEELAVLIAGAVHLGLPFKCTAGLHSAVRHLDPATGFAHHGFLNILVAVIRAEAGGSQAEVRAILGLEDESILARSVEVTTQADLIRARALFRSYGSCSIDEPLADLRRIGLEPGVTP